MLDQKQVEKKKNRPKKFVATVENSGFKEDGTNGWIVKKHSVRDRVHLEKNGESRIVHIEELVQIISIFRGYCRSSILSGSFYVN